MKRRDLLKSFSAIGLSTLFGRVIDVAAAEMIKSVSENGAIENYIQFNLYGAPARWMYDNPLSPYGDSFVRNPYVGTHFKHGNRFADDFVDYKHISLKGVNFPYLWSQRPLDDLKEKDFSGLAENFANIRGVWVGRDGHIPASSKILNDNNVGTYGELFKNDQNKLIDGFISGKAPTFDGERLHREFDLFQLEDVSSFQKSFYETLIEAKGIPSDQELEKILLDNMKVLSGSSPNSIQTKKTKMLKELKDLREKFILDFPIILNKYYKIFNRSKEHLLAGILLKDVFDKSIQGVPIDPVYDGVILNRHMSRFHVFTDYSDIRKGFESVTMDEWLNNFAIAEFLVVNGFTQSVILTPPAKGNIFENYYFNNVFSKVEFQHKKPINGNRHFKKEELSSFYGPLEMDAHNAGTVLNLMANSYFFYVFHSCLNSLVKTLKKEDIFSKTLIHVASEFERKPKSDELGSNHNSIGQVHSLYSGRIKGPFFLGDVHRVDPQKTISGTCNTGAFHRELKRYISYSDFHHTISHLFGESKKTDKVHALLKLEKGKIVPNISRSRVV